MKILKLSEDKKKKKKDPTRGSMMFGVYPNYEEGIDLLNHALGNDDVNNATNTVGEPGGESSSSSSSTSGSCGEALSNRGKLMTNRQIKESIKKLENAALAEDLQYYDLYNLYEALEAELTDDDRAEISKMLRDKTKGYNEVNTYLAGVASRKNNKNGMASNNNIQASVVDEEYYRSTIFGMLDGIDDDHTLTEGRNDLVAKKCVSIETNNTYWSPYDTKTKDFAKFGIRFRYEDKDACLEAINDPDNDLGYEYWEKKAKDAEKDKKNKNSGEVTESVITEFKSSSDVEPVEDVEDIEDNEQEINDTVEPIVIDKDELIEIIKSHNTDSIDDDFNILAYNHKLYKTDNKTGKKKLWKDIELLVAVYQLTNGGDPSIGIPRFDVSVKAGAVKDKDRAVDSKNSIDSQYWNELKNDKPNLIDVRKGVVYPTTALKPFIENTQIVFKDKQGSNQLVDRHGNPVTINLKTDIIDAGLTAEPDSRNNQGEQAQRAHGDEIKAAKDGTKAIKAEEQDFIDAVSSSGGTFVGDLIQFPWDFFDGNTTNESLDNIDNEKIEKYDKYLKMYRDHLGLDEDAEIIPRPYTDAVVKTVAYWNSCKSDDIWEAINYHYNKLGEKNENK